MRAKLPFASHSSPLLARSGYFISIFRFPLSAFRFYRRSGFRFQVSGLRFILILLLLAAVTGCRLIQGVAEAPAQAVRAVTPGKPGQPAADPVEVQQNLLRFADEYWMRAVTSVDVLRRGTNALAPVEILQIKIALGTEICSIASGPNAVADLLDMTVFVTLSRKALEDYWCPRVFGESARPLLEYSRNFETEIWQLVDQVLTPEQSAELRGAIASWHLRNQMPESIVTPRALGFTSRVTAPGKAEEAKPGSVFSLLKVDPLAGMDPAVREIAQTRLFAERALYVTQKMPMLLRWQTELLSVNAMEMPAARQLVANATSIAASVDRFAVVAEKLPGQISAERAEILKALQSQEKDAASLLAAGTRMSDSLNTTLNSLDLVLKRFGVGETNNAGSPKPKTEPFRIQDYTATATQLDATARQITALLVTLDQTLGSTNLVKLSAQVAPVMQRAQTSGREIVDYAFWKGMLLVASLLLAALIYRLLSVRMNNSKTKSP